MIILPFFTNLTGEKLNDLKNALDQLVAFNFPMRSDEFAKGTLKHNNYVDCTKKVSIFNKCVIRSLSELWKQCFTGSGIRETLNSHEEISLSVSELCLYPEV